MSGTFRCCPEAGSRRQGEGLGRRALDVEAAFGLLPLDALEELGEAALRDQPFAAELQARQGALLQVLVDGVLIDAELLSDPFRVAVIQPGPDFPTSKPSEPS